MKRGGLTLIEVIIVIAIIGILMAILLPAIQSARASARRTQCVSNLRQFGVAMHAFHDQYAMFPPGNAKFKSLHVSILPFIDQQALYATLPVPYTGMQLDQVARTPIVLFKCPADSGSDYIYKEPNPVYPTNYMGNFGTGVQENGYDGMFQSLGIGRVTASDVTDGLSNTSAIAESLVGNSSSNLRRIVIQTPFPLIQMGQLEQFAALCRATATGGTPQNFSGKGRPWSSGDPGITLYNHVLYPNDASCTNNGNVQEGAYSAGSEHPGGANVLMGDGHVKFFSTQVNLGAWRAVGSRQGGEALGDEVQ